MLKRYDPTETRTPVAGMKTRCPRPLDDGAKLSQLEMSQRLMS